MPIHPNSQIMQINEITISRSERQRREIKDLEPLVASIKRVGIINPLVVTREGLLVAGERRLTAAREAGLWGVPVRFADELAPGEAKLIELEENAKRKDLPWQDLVAAVSSIHALHCELDEDWTQSQTAEVCALSEGVVSMYLTLGGKIAEGDERLLAATTVREAYNQILRQRNRQMGAALEELLELPPEPQLQVNEALSQTNTTDESAVTPPKVVLPMTMTPEGVPPLPPYTPTLAPIASAQLQAQAADVRRRQAARLLPDEAILQESFLDWAPQYDGPKFNLLHCDFPYGVNLFNGPQGGEGSAPAGAYQDTKETYFELLQCLLRNLDRLMSVSAHLMFWFSEKHRDQTLKMFAELAPGLRLYPYPLIWLKSDNAGIAGDSTRHPRHIYETCLFATRSGRQIVKIVGDAYACPTDRKLHASAKPEPMLKHFMTMLVDNHTRLLDPTCGGGSALRAAEALGAEQVMGLEIDGTSCQLARDALRQARALAGRR